MIARALIALVKEKRRLIAWSNYQENQKQVLTLTKSIQKKRPSPVLRVKQAAEKAYNPCCRDRSNT